MTRRYVEGCEPDQTRTESAVDSPETRASGVSGTTHGVNKTTPQEASERIKQLRGLLKPKD